jgi:hypothetical protein
VQLKILTYAPTEFFHCQHCEIVWDGIGLGQRVHAEQRASGLPADLQAEYQAIAEWLGDTQRRYGQQLQVTMVDVASVEGLVNAVRHRVRRFPAFIVDGQERVVGFDRQRLDATLVRRMASRG